MTARVPLLQTRTSIARRSTNQKVAHAFPRRRRSQSGNHHRGHGDAPCFVFQRHTGISTAVESFRLLQSTELWWVSYKHHLHVATSGGEHHSPFPHPSFTLPIFRVQAYNFVTRACRHQIKEQTRSRIHIFMCDCVFAINIFLINPDVDHALPVWGGGHLQLQLSSDYIDARFLASTLRGSITSIFTKHSSSIDFGGSSTCFHNFNFYKFFSSRLPVLWCDCEPAAYICLIDPDVDA